MRDAARRTNVVLGEKTMLFDLNLVLLSQQPHDNVVIPDVADLSGLTFPPLFDKSAGAITTYCSLIEC